MEEGQWVVKEKGRVERVPGGWGWFLKASGEGVGKKKWK